ncbi:hypothetical protein OAM18_01960 [Candidatus Pelagibacter sp.]|nr:hypothetical protein [Candidatus Pelagibacter sp.]
MKLLRISLLLNFFKDSKNKEKFLAYINIGLFLSMFAISAAVITFVIETKIDKIEFDLILVHKEKKSDQRTIDELIKIQSQTMSLNTAAKALIGLYEYTASTKLGEYTVSVNDIYLPSVFIDTEDAVTYAEFLDEDIWIPFTEVLTEDLGKESEEVKELKKALENLDKYQDFFKKDFSKYYANIFNYDANKVSKEARKKTAINYWDDEVYEDYLILDKIFEEMIVLLEVMYSYYDILDIYYEETISELNKKILDLSRLETKVIIFAFIFQFIAFLIIQYFEIKSIQNEKGLNAKRKIK